MKTVIEVVEDATGDVVHTIKTDKTGASLEKLLNGLHRKVDFSRFTVRIGASKAGDR